MISFYSTFNAQSQYQLEVFSGLFLQEKQHQNTIKFRATLDFLCKHQFLLNFFALQIVWNHTQTNKLLISWWKTNILGLGFIPILYNFSVWKRSTKNAIEQIMMIKIIKKKLPMAVWRKVSLSLNEKTAQKWVHILSLHRK